MPSSDPIQRFTDILENIIRIEEFTAGMDAGAFVGDPKTYDAVERCLERISEAASKLGPQAEKLCPGIPWSQIRAVGNRLRHEYDRISGPRIWLMVERDLAPLKGAVRTVLSHLLAKEGEE
ncbi:MAG: HepT-like ribonuclease domain-containing protein [Bryobacteraceae bacterium]